MKRIFIEYSDNGIRTALLEGSKLQEIYIDPLQKNSWVGRIIVGRLQTILPGQFAFVDIGGRKNAFMNLSHGHGLKAGQPILVQVQKDAVKAKGMYVSQTISLKGRLLVLHENLRAEVGVSRKITDEKENTRLRKMVRKLLPKGFGAIVRTNAEGQDKEIIWAEIKNLHEIYLQIKERAQYALPPTRLYPVEENQIFSLFTDLIADDIAEIHISGTMEAFDGAKNAIKALLLSAENKISYYEGENAPTMFAHYGINRQISAALEKTIKLPCGGFITIEETEACVVIDVNTGSNVGKINYQNTVFETNKEAAVTIAEQIRLRNLSGIILIDFIDMDDEGNKNALLLALNAELKKDRIRAEIIGMMGLGMVQLTRRKMRPTLSGLIESTCPTCGGKGKIFT
ncbi:MAG: ribonuclease E/G [Defluviitaleaceae bacterium]|nr:ribonuclease E/G [Defluviitaleaceae bacterium]